MRCIAFVNASSAIFASLACNTISKSTAICTWDRENRCSASSPETAAGSAISNSPIAGVDCMANSSLSCRWLPRELPPLAAVKRNGLDRCAALFYCSRPMSFWRYALMLFLALAMVRAICGQTPLGSQSGVLVLRNGHVLLGDVTRAGDYYIVSPSQGSELRLKNDEVELFCGSMDEAYEFKARHLSGLSAKPHLELAKWCLRQGLYDKCSDQIAAARRAEPDNQDAKDLETRLKLIVEAPPEPTPAKAAPTVAAEELERALRDLPRGSVEKFGTNVQPILLNRCGLNK